MLLLLALCILSLSSSCESYLLPQVSRFPHFRVEGKFEIEKYIMARNPHKVLHMVVQEKEVAPEDLTLFTEAKETPRFFDLPAYYTTLANHAVIIGATFLLGAVLNVDLLRLKDLVFDWEAVAMAALVSIPMVAFSFLWRGLESIVPGGLIMNKSTKEVKTALLMLFGRDTNAWKVAGLTIVHAFVVGLAESLLFRGLLINYFIQLFTGDIAVAILTSAGVSALAHVPFKGTAVLPEIAFSSVFGVIYASAGFNLLVPVLMYTIYESMTNFLVWRSASDRLRERVLKNRTQTLETNTYDNPLRFKILVRRLFDYLDINNDGLITKEDLSLGHRLFCHYSSSFRKAYQRDSPTMLFMAIDSGGDGLVDYEEFLTHCRNSPGRASWVYKCCAIVDEETSG